ncbi:putative membrane protein [Kribbella orskensis]|uniref:Membrane protein n=1 Tax=Kribbella orskensis TaxID=2512216 RepID=A0ABY2BEK0_9ACTN|nr:MULTISPECIES: DUF1622 domain-containing protein [Kribbella]TCN36698.1 putative membrane protein [Kribbella sp. VKM Ac-2500]TCO17937.1 putative membrane protein [Kribbella orskensis]
MTFSEVMDQAAEVFEGLGAVILTLGFVWSVVLAAAVWRRTKDGSEAFATLRQSFGAALLLALEVLVAADLIRTVAVAPTLENVTVLAVIVLIRTVLSFSLEVEIEGVVPWRRALVTGPTRIAQVSRRSRESNPE